LSTDGRIVARRRQRAHASPKSSRRQLAANEGIQAAIIDQHSIAGVIGFGRLDWENRSATFGYWPC
jgi:hypothetical protein